MCLLLRTDHRKGRKDRISGSFRLEAMVHFAKIVGKEVIRSDQNSEYSVLSLMDRMWDVSGKRGRG